MRERDKIECDDNGKCLNFSAVQQKMKYENIVKCFYISAESVSILTQLNGLFK